MDNEYGLDANYFKNKLSLIARDADNYTPDEMYRELTRLAEVARPAQITKILNNDGVINMDKLKKLIEDSEGMDCDCGVRPIEDFIIKG